MVGHRNRQRQRNRGRGNKGIWCAVCGNDKEEVKEVKPKKGLFKKK